MSVVVTVQRESDEEEEDEAEEKDSTVGRVVCPRYGLEKTEAYWLVIGDSNSNALLSIKRITIGEKPSKVLMTAITLYHINESYNIVINYISNFCLILPSPPPTSFRPSSSSRHLRTLETTQ